jgi:two-component system cell cycle sensor histidine kinase PleC
MTDREKTREQLILELDALRVENTRLTNALAEQERATDSARHVAAGDKDLSNLKQAHDVLHPVQDDPKNRVEERTSQLMHINAQLEKEIADHNLAVKALRDSEEKYRLVVENVNEAILVVQSGVITYANAALSKRSGFSMDELQQKPFLEMVHPDYREMVANRYRRRIRGEQVPDAYSFRAVDKEGRPWWGLFSIVPVTWDSNPAHLVFATDITEFKQTEEALRESESRFREIAELLPQFVYEVDIKGNFTFMNRSGLEAFGYTHEEFGRGINALEVFIPEERNRIAKNISAMLKGERSDGREFILMRKDGSNLPVVTYSSPIMRNGRIEGLRGIAADISDRKRSETAIRESEERYRMLTQNSLTGIYIHQNNLVTFVNDRLAHMVGYSPDEMIGKRFWEFIHPKDKQMVKDRGIARSKGEDVPQNYEFRMIRKDGTTIWVEIMATTILAGGRTANMGNLADITARKEAEAILRQDRDALEQRVKERTAELIQTNETLKTEISVRKRAEEDLRGAKEAAEKANRAKSEFLANMSHELRTPLNAVIGFSEILQDQTFGPLNEKQMKYVGHVVGSGRHLLQTINDILDLAKVESGRLRLQLTQVSVSGLLRSSVTMIRKKAERHGLKLNLTVDNALTQVKILADEIKLKQIMFNLLTNSAKFTPDNGSISIVARRASEELVVSVSDTGIGVKQEDTRRIFDPFEQVDSSLRRRHQGTGLGLALTRRLVELHDGRIWVESEGPGQGSTFSFTIPLVETAASGISTEYAAPRRMMEPPENGYELQELDDSWVNFQVTTTHDQLTGLWNRSAITDMLQREFARASREGGQVGIIAATIDAHERIYDQMGCLAGEAVLREVAHRLSTCVRPYDIVGRYDEDEFIIVLPGSGSVGSANTAERLRRSISDNVVMTPGGSLTITASFGIAVTGGDGDITVDGLLGYAEEALHTAKTQGGNKAVIA